MKPLFLILSLTILTAFSTLAQTTHDISGIVVDTTKLSLPGSSIKLVSNGGDSTISIADANGKFAFSGIKGSKITLTLSSIGFTSIKKHFALNPDGKPVDLGNIIMKASTNMLNVVTIVGVNPVTLKEDTVEYNASAYKVRENAPAEDLIKKLPGVDVDVNGNITTQGKQVTKVRINGKDFMGGDVQSATKNLPADVIENIQMIDDYGDQANLTGVKTGEPDKIMNITIRKDKNYGYFGQATAGGGRDALPQSQDIPDKNRYIGSVNAFNFNGDQQIALLGSINNTNVNTFSFGSPAGGGGGGIGGGGGRGNAGRGGNNSGSLITTQNGITNAHSIGTNFRDQWGKSLSVYGSYSFADNTVATLTNNIQQNQTTPPSTQNQNSNETDKNVNHRFTWNMEYKPDTINYLKVTPTFSYAGINTNETENSTLTRDGSVNTAFTSASTGDSQAPNYGLTALFNHRLKNRQNLSITVNVSSAPSWSFQNPAYEYTIGAPPQGTPLNQMINTYSRTNSYGTNVSYLHPIGKRSYLELNYAFNRAVTTNNKETDTLFNVADFSYRSDSTLSTRYNYTFTTNRVGLNYRFIEKKYNYTLGLGVQPSVLDGNSPITGISTHISSFNFIPTARFIYNFSRSQSFSVNYNGSSSTPSFTQLQPIIDVSNALYPVQGNPFLKPQFTNNISIRYNKFSFQTGDVFFANFQFQKIDNQVVTNTITAKPSTDATGANNSNNTILTQYLNADGYYTASGRLTYSKPWENRKYTLSFNGTATYTNNVGYITSVDGNPRYASQQEIDDAREKNIAKNLALTPELRFRVDINNVIDAQFLTNYAINRTSNSLESSTLNGTNNIRTWNIGLTGKNYFGDWVFSYDYSKATNYGYNSNINVTNPNILNLYVERRFLKNKQATLRLSGFDLFNQNTGFSTTTTASSFTQTRVNRLSRYYLLTFTLNLKKFAGKAPVQDDMGPGRRFRDGNGGGRRDGGGSGGGVPGVPGGLQ